MRISLLPGKLLPESLADFEKLYTQGGATYMRCCLCNNAFGAENVRTERGWAESQISGMCENCWDGMFGEES